MFFCFIKLTTESIRSVNPNPSHPGTKRVMAGLAFFKKLVLSLPFHQGVVWLPPTNKAPSIWIRPLAIVTSGCAGKLLEKVFFSLISSIDFTPVDATEGINLFSSIQCSNVRRGIYASFASFIAISTVGLLVALVFLGRMRARSVHSFCSRSANWA